MKRTLLPALSTSFMLLFITACGENAEGEGPMERSGKALDEAAEKTGEAIKEGTEKVGEGLEKVGEKLQDDEGP